MPTNPPPKIAILTGSSSEFYRWKAASQAVDEMIHRVIDAEMFPEPLQFISMLCLPMWRSGYTQPDVMLNRVRICLIAPPRAPIPEPIPGTDGDPANTGMETLMVPDDIAAQQAAATGALREILASAAVDRRTPAEVLRVWGVSTDIPQYVPTDCLNSLVAMMRLADGGLHSRAGQNGFIGFYLQFLAHRYHHLNRVGVAQSPVRMPRLPDDTPLDMIDLFPIRLIMEELRLLSGDEDWVRQVPPRDGFVFMWENWRLQQMLSDNVPGDVIHEQRVRLGHMLHGFRASSMSPIPSPMTRGTISREEADRFHAAMLASRNGPRTVPPPIEPTRSESYVPGTQLSRIMERMAREARAENEARLREAAMRFRRP